MYNSFDLYTAKAENFDDVFSVERAKIIGFHRSTKTDIVADSAYQRVISDVRKFRSDTNKARKLMRDAGDTSATSVDVWSIIRHLFNPSGEIKGFPILSEAETAERVYKLYSLCSKALGWKGGYSASGFKRFVTDCVTDALNDTNNSRYLSASEVFIASPDELALEDALNETEARQASN